MLGDFNVPNYDWINGAPVSNSYYYNKIKENSIHTPTCFLGLDQRNNSIIGCALINLVFSDISDINASISHYPVVTPDNYHPPFLLDFNLTLVCHPISLTPHRSWAQGYTIMSYAILMGRVF
jgi:hypothetical protein